MSTFTRYINQHLRNAAGAASMVADLSANSITFPDTNVDTVNDDLNLTSHGVTEDDPIMFVNRAGNVNLPPDLDPDVIYYAFPNPGAPGNNLGVALAPGGDYADRVAFSADGTGNHTLLWFNDNSVYSAGPEAGKVWLVDNILLTMVDGSSSDADDFGSISGGITCGLRFFITDSDGIPLHRFLEAHGIRDNGEFTHFFSDFVRSAYGSGSDHFIAQCFPEDKFGTPIILDGDKGDRLAVHVGDDLSDLEYLDVNIFGREFKKGFSSDPLIEITPTYQLKDS